MGWVSLLSCPTSSSSSFGACYFNGKLYIGTRTGELWSSDLSAPFVKVASPIIVSPFVVGCTIDYLFVWSGVLYAWSSQTTCLIKWNGTNAWVFLSKGDNNGSAGRAAVLGSFFYGSAWARFYKWDNASSVLTTINDLGSPGLTLSDTINGGDGFVYFTGSHGNLYRSNGGSATLVASGSGLGGLTSLVLHAGEVYGVGPSCKLMKFNGTNAWVVVVAASLSNLTPYSVLSSNGKIYIGGQGGGLSGACYSWASGSSWTLVAASPASGNLVETLIEAPDGSLLAKIMLTGGTRNIYKALDVASAGAVLPASTAMISHARILKDHRAPIHAEAFHNAMQGAT